MSAASRIEVEIAGSSASLRDAVVSAADSLKGLADQIVKSMDVAKRSGEKTITLNDAVAKSFEGVAAKAGLASDRTIAAFERQGAVILDGSKAQQAALAKSGEAASVSAAEQARAAGVAVRSAEETAAAARAGADGQVAASERSGRASEAAAAAAKAGSAEQVRASERAAAAGRKSADSQASSAKKTQAAFGGSQSALTKIGKTLTLGIAGAAVASVYAAAKFQSATTLFETQAGASSKQVDQLRAGILRMAADVGQTPDQLAKGMYHVVSSMNALIPKAQRVRVELQVLRAAAEGAAVGHTNLEETAYALASAMNALHAPGRDALKIMGDLNAIVGAGDMTMTDLLDSLKSGLIPTAQTFGVSFKSVGAALAVMGDMGMRGALAGTRLRMSLALLGAPSEKAAKLLVDIGLSSKQATAQTDFMRQVLEKAGLRVTQMASDLRQPNGILYALADLNNHLKSSGLSAQAAGALVSDAFGGGRSGATIQLLEHNLERVNVKYQQIGKTAGDFPKAFKITQGTLTFQLHQIEGGVEALAVGLGTKLIPVVEHAITDIKDLAAWFEHNKTALHALEGVVVTFAAVAIGSYFTSKIKQGIGLLKDFRSAAKGVVDLLMKPGIFQGPAAKPVAPGAGGSAGAGGTSGPLGFRIVGTHGPVDPGSLANPIVVAIEAGEYAGLGSEGAAGTVSAETNAAKAEVASAETKAASAGAAGVGDAAAVRAASGGAPGAILPVAGGAAETAAAETGLLSSLKTGISGLLGGLARSAGIAGIGVLGSQAVGSMVGGKPGQDISSIGTKAALGAALGSFLGPEGTLAGGVLGGLVGAFQTFDKNDAANYGNDMAAKFTQGLGLKVADQFHAGLASAISSAHQDAQQAQAVTSAVMADVPSDPMHRMLERNLKDAPALEKQAAAAYAKVGTEAGAALVTALQGVKFPSEPIFQKDFQSELSRLPPDARDAAAKVMLQWAGTLEQQGQMPKAALDQLISSLEAKFPGLQTYVTQQGVQTATVIAQAMRLQQAQSNWASALETFRSQWGDLAISQNITSGNIVQNTKLAFAALKETIATSSGQQRKDAVGEYDRLRTQVSGTFERMLSNLKAKQASMKQSIKAGSHEATHTAAENFWHFADSTDKAMKSGVISTQKGGRLIEQALNSTLKSFGAKPIPIVQAVQTVDLGLIAAGSALNWDHGGYIGNQGEKGRDTVTAVLGRGEAVLKHQDQAIVNGALAGTPYGSLAGVFAATAGQKHWMASGGFAGAGPTLTYPQLEGLWDQANPGLRNMAPIMAAIAMAESTGRDITNSIGAAGYWQIYGLPFPGNPLDPITNAHMAAAKLQSQGLNAWVTYQTGAYKAYVHGGAPGSLAGLGVGGASIPAPKVEGTGTVSAIVKAGLAEAATAATDYLSKQTVSGNAAGGSGAMPVYVMPGGSMPPQVASMLSAANSIIGRPYVLGGGHGGWQSPSYDCSGAVSYVLHAGGQLAAPEVTDELKSFGLPGPGKWVTVGVRGFGSEGQTMMSLAGKYVEAGGGGPFGAGDVHWDPGWDGVFPWLRHPAGLAGGGYADGNIGERASARQDYKRTVAGTHFPTKVLPSPKAPKAPTVKAAPKAPAAMLSSKDMQDLSSIGGQVNSIEAAIAQLTGSYQADTTLFPPQEAQPQFLNPDGSLNPAGYQQKIADDNTLLGIDQQLLGLYLKEVPVVSAALAKYLGKDSQVDAEVAKDTKREQGNRARLAADKITTAGYRKQLQQLGKPDPDSAVLISVEGQLTTAEQHYQQLEQQIASLKQQWTEKIAAARQQWTQKLADTRLSYLNRIAAAEQAKISWDESTLGKELALEDAVLQAERGKLGYSTVQTADRLKQAIITAQANQHAFTGSPAATLSDAAAIQQEDTRKQLSLAVDAARQAYSEFLLSQAPVKAAMAAGLSRAQLSLRDFTLSEKPTRAQLEAAISDLRSGETMTLAKMRIAKTGALNDMQTAELNQVDPLKTDADVLKIGTIDPLRSQEAALKLAIRRHAEKVKTEKYAVNRKISTLTARDAQITRSDSTLAADVANLKAILAGQGGGTGANVNQAVGVLETVAGKLGEVIWTGGRFSSIDTTMPGEIVSVKADILSLQNDIAAATTGAATAASSSTTAADQSALIQLLEQRNLQLSEELALGQAQTLALTSMIPMIPSYDKGGPILKDTLAMVHEGEHVVPREGALVVRDSPMGNRTHVLELHQHFHGDAGPMMDMVDQRFHSPENVMVVSKQLGRRTRLLQGAPGGGR